MKKILFLLLTIVSILFSSCKTDEETKELSAQEKAQMCLVLSGIEFEDCESFISAKQSWNEPLNYSFSYTYSPGFMGVPCMGLVNVVVENGVVTKKELSMFKGSSSEYKDKIPVFTSISEIYEYCQASYEEAQGKKYTHFVTFKCEFEDSDYGKYPLEFIVCSTNWLIGVSIPSGSIAGPIPSEPSFSIRITDFKIN